MAGLGQFKFVHSHGMENRIGGPIEAGGMGEVNARVKNLPVEETHTKAALRTMG